MSSIRTCRISKRCLASTVFAHAISLLAAYSCSANCSAQLGSDATPFLSDSTNNVASKAKESGVASISDIDKKAEVGQRCKHLMAVGEKHGWASLGSGGSGIQCAIKVDNTAWCWETTQNKTDQDDCFSLAIFDEAVKYSYIGTGRDMTCGISREKKLRCQGDRRHTDYLDKGLRWDIFTMGGYQQFCGSTTGGRFLCGDSEVDKMQEFTSVSKPKQIAVGHRHVCVLDGHSSLLCWGSNLYGQLGAGKKTDIDNAREMFVDRKGVLGGNPTLIQPRDRWKSISAGLYHSCGIKADGTMWYWGRMCSPWYCDSDIETEPRRVGLDGNWESVFSGKGRTCAIKNDRSLWCWGIDACRMNDDQSASPPNFKDIQRIGQDERWKSVSIVDEYLACGITVDNSIYCWGVAIDDIRRRTEKVPSIEGEKRRK